MTLTPQNEAELAEAIKGSAGPLKIRGGGTRPVGQPGAGAVLSTTGLRGVRLYEPGALTLVVGGGTALSEVEALLASENQRLAFEPMDHRALLGTQGESTIGAVVAANISGPRRVQAGACRDFLLGVRFVDGRGDILKNGGRVMKNVTGYDLVKLMAGSFGTLAVLSEVSLKVLPRPETEATLALEGLDDARAVAALSAALGSAFDVTGAAHRPGGQTLIRLEGFAASVAYRVERLTAHLARFGAPKIISDAQNSAALWRGVRDVADFHGGGGDVWRISVKPSDGPKVGDRLDGIATGLLYDWGGGLIWARVAEGTDLRSHLAGIPGHARLERAADAVKARLGVFGSGGAVADRLAAGLRARFDPDGKLNRGLMG